MCKNFMTTKAFQFERHLRVFFLGYLILIIFLQGPPGPVGMIGPVGPPGKDVSSLLFLQ